MSRYDPAPPRAPSPSPPPEGKETGVPRKKEKRSHPPSPRGRGKKAEEEQKNGGPPDEKKGARGKKKRSPDIKLLIVVAPVFRGRPDEARIEAGAPSTGVGVPVIVRRNVDFDDDVFGQLIRRSGRRNCGRSWPSEPWPMLACRDCSAVAVDTVRPKAFECSATCALMYRHVSACCLS